MASQTSVHMKITVDASNADVFLKALKPVFDAVVADPKNTFIEVYQDEQNPGVFRLVENWDASVEYLKEVQPKKEYLKPYLEAVIPMLVKPLEVEYYKRPGDEWVNVRKGVYPDREQ